MRKSTLFISAALTTFMLAVLFGVVSAYKNIISPTQDAAVQSQLTETELAMEITATPTPVQVINISPEEAAAIASKVINRTDLYSAESTQFEGVDAYLVTFSSGDIVYIGLDGQVLSISKIAVTVVTEPSIKRGGKANNSGGSEHEDEHEDESDED